MNSLKQIGQIFSGANLEEFQSDQDIVRGNFPSDCGKFWKYQIVVQFTCRRLTGNRYRDCEALDRREHEVGGNAWIEYQAIFEVGRPSARDNIDSFDIRVTSGLPPAECSLQNVFIGNKGYYCQVASAESDRFPGHTRRSSVNFDIYSALDKLGMTANPDGYFDPFQILYGLQVNLRNGTKMTTAMVAGLQGLVEWRTKYVENNPN